MTNMGRRSSSGVLLSPEVEFTGRPIGDASENDFIVKKNSQRRITLLDILVHDKDKICDVWLQKIESNHDVDVVLTRVIYKIYKKLIEFISFWLTCNALTIVFDFFYFLQEHLEIMNGALRDFISDQNRAALESVMTAFKMKKNCDATAIDHLHLALLSFKVCAYSYKCIYTRIEVTELFYLF